MTNLKEKDQDKAFGITKKELDHSYNDFVAGIKKEAKIFKVFEDNNAEHSTFFDILIPRKK